MVIDLIGNFSPHYRVTIPKSDKDSQWRIKISSMDGGEAYTPAVSLVYTPEAMQVSSFLGGEQEQSNGVVLPSSGDRVKIGGNALTYLRGELDF